MDAANQYQTKIVDNLLNKFVSEEIMTKSEFKLQIDEIMTRHEYKLDQRFAAIDQKFDKIEHSISHTMRWNLSIAVGTVVALGGLMITLFSLVPH